MSGVLERPRNDASLDARLNMRKCNKLQLGLFGSNARYGRAATKVPEAWSGSWEDNLRMAQMADEAGIDFILPLARWRGYRGTSNFHGTVLEATAFACGLLASTRNITVFSTIHVPFFHPVVAAKQFATADHIGRGRFGINVVVGWNTDEFQMFGLDIREHDNRYEYESEWVEVVKKLWTQQGSFDYEGRFLNLKDLQAEPKPYGGTRPIIMNAGASKAGRGFAIEHSDILFSLLITPEQGAKAVAETRAQAEAMGRKDIRIFTPGYYVCRPTRREAEEYHRWYVDENGDEEALEHLFELQFPNPEARTLKRLDELKARHIGGNGSYPMIGSPDDVATELAKVSALGYTAMCSSFVNYNDEFPYFRDEVLPRLERLGLRQKFTST